MKRPNLLTLRGHIPKRGIKSLVDFQSQPQQSDLLNEPLSDAEVRNLLERLGSQEFGGPETATLGVVAEATGSDPTAVGRLLAEIRKGEFEKKFGLQLQDHGQRIETLEERTKRLEPKPPVVAQQPLDRYQKIALDRLAAEERQKERMWPYGYIGVGVIAVIAFIAMLVGGQNPSSSNANATSPGSQSVTRISVGTTDGKVLLDNNNKVWVDLNRGGTREATAEERAWVYSAKNSGERSK